MPLIEIKHVISFTSEDVKHPAENLLKPEMYYKWRCLSGSEKQAIVILQLEKASQIHQVDIGNNGSAFIEVLVGQSSWDPKEEYQVLIVASTFMSPADSKSSTNPNRVRMFGSGNLNKAVADKKWDRVKVICTQPYNKEEPYGLSFLKFHALPEDEAKPSTEGGSSSKPLRIGGFALRDEPSTPSMSIGNLFKKRTLSTPSPSSISSMSLAAAARDASTTFVGATFKNSPSLSTPISNSAARKFSPLSTSLTKKSDTTADKTGRPENSKRKAENSSSKEPSSVKIKQKEVLKVTAAPPAKKVKTAETPRIVKPTVPFKRILAKVVFVLSGFKNPERGDLREKALAMGAQYRPDWTPDSTHLICAFRNTPKFNQVKGKGKIVSKKWIVDCERKREGLPTRSYRMDGGGSSSEGEEEEIRKATPMAIESSDGRLKDDQMTITGSTAEQEKAHIIDDPHGGDTAEQKKTRVIDDPYEGDTDGDDNTPVLDENPGPSRPRKDSSSECDTEDELRKVREAQDDPYGGSTEEEENDNTKDEPANTSEAVTLNRQQSELPHLPDFFDGKHFFFYGSFDDKTRRVLNRYITAYSGTVHEYMDDDVEYVITDDDWDKNFDEALEENTSLVFVRSKWIFKCHEKSAWVAYQPHVIVPR